MARKDAIYTGTVAVRALRPVQPRGKPWHIAEGRVAADTAEDAEAFAATLVESMRAMAAREDARRAVPAAFEYKCAGHEDGTYHQSIPGGDGRSAHTGRCPMNGPRGTARTVYGDPAPILALAERFAARRPAPIKADAPRRAPRRAPARKAAPPPPPQPLVPPPAPERGYRPAPCERCGKTFRTDAGARWHAANNRDCERWTRKGRAA